MDALTPAEITAKADEIGYKKANWKFSNTLVSGILAGMYISFGAVFSITSISGLAGNVPFGIVKIIAWLAFSLGLILVMVAGAELFTWNALLIISWLNKRISGLQITKNLILIWFSNFIGALIVILLVYVWWWYLFGDGIVWETVLNIWVHKLDYWFFQALSLWILCNILVCLGVWIAWSAKSVWDKVLWIIFPITAFVAWWFEHLVANMFYLPFAYLLKITGFAAETIDTTHLTLKYVFLIIYCLLLCEI